MGLTDYLGKKRRLMIVKEVEFGVYLGNKDDKVLLPKKQVPKDVAYANSLWVYMDMEKGRPSRPEESEIAPYGVGDSYEMEFESRKIALPKEAKELESFPVRRYHIDTNEHVNNCQYVQMALESLPKDKEVHQMRVEYKKSAVYGDVIYPRIAIEEDRTVIELCNEKARPYAVIEFKFA